MKYWHVTLDNCMNIEHYIVRAEDADRAIAKAIRGATHWKTSVEEITNEVTHISSEDRWPQA